MAVAKPPQAAANATDQPLKAAESAGGRRSREQTLRTGGEAAQDRETTYQRCCHLDTTYKVHRTLTDIKAAIYVTQVKVNTLWAEQDSVIYVVG